MIAKYDEDALKEFYSAYKAAFYAVSMSVIKNEAGARAAASDAFVCIRELAPRFEDEMDAEYWIFDILYKLCAGRAKEIKRAGKSEYDTQGLLKAEPEAIIGAYTKLSASDIAALTGKRRASVTAVIKNIKQSGADALKKAADAACPDYWEDIVSKIDTETQTELSDEDKTHSGLSKKSKEERAKGNYYKRIIAVILLVSFLSGVVLLVVNLIRNNYSGDVDKNALGEDMLLQFNNNTAMTEMNGSIYYRGADSAFYKRNMSTGETAKISDDHPMELLNDGKYIYYRNNRDGYMYRIDENGGDRTQLCDAPGTSMELYGGYLYFSSTGGIYRIPESGGKMDDAELMLDTSTDVNLYCVDMAIDEAGNVFFASGIGRGVHHITEYNGEPSVDGVFIDEVYTLQIDDGKLYFDYKDMSGRITLYGFGLDSYYDFLENTGSQRVWPQPVESSAGTDIVLSTGAFFAKDGNVYYAGTSGGLSALYMLNASGNTEKLTDIAGGSRNLYITDIYVSDDYVYCYCSDGRSGGNSLLFAYDIDTHETVKVY